MSDKSWNSSEVDVDSAESEPEETRQDGDKKIIYSILVI